jgi:Mrp family chromosome partitioning ATPase
MARIGHKLMVLSGKGGVGKSTVAVNLAGALALAGKEVGLLDIDVHGPSIPKMLHIEKSSITGGESGMQPVTVGERLHVMSMGLLIQRQDAPVIWRGPLKYNLIKEFLRDVDWGKLDYLVVDSPPGTGDEPLSVAQLVDHADGAIVVTTPQDVAVVDVRRCISFCGQVGLKVLGVIENMSGFVCPSCGARTGIFGSGGGETMARSMGLPFLGAIPMDPEIVASGDQGVPFVQAHPESEAAKAFGKVIQNLRDRMERP